MKLAPTLLGLCATLTAATIYQNDQVRITDYPDTTIAPITSADSKWRAYLPNATELSYKGRWDDKYISYWTAPGLKFGFQGSQIAINFGNWTSRGVLIAYRVGGLDWELTNVTSNSTHLLADAQTTGFDEASTQTFELRVTNWGYGAQIQNLYVSGGKLSKIPEYTRTMELIGDSLSAGQYRTLEAISGYTFGLAYGFGNVEFSITAYPGICAYDGGDGFCYGGGPRQRGQERQWLKVSDNSQRAIDLYGDDPPDWNFSAQPAADITLINLGANDHGQNVPEDLFFNAYIKLINEIRQRWPQTQIIILNLWDFSKNGSTWTTQAPLDNVIQNVARHFNGGTLTPRHWSPPGSSAGSGWSNQGGFVHYFNTTGILQHNDVGPTSHPTDAGDLKLASHLMQYIKLKFGWDLEQTGPEVQHETTYWNDQSSY